MEADSIRLVDVLLDGLSAKLQLTQPPTSGGAMALSALQLHVLVLLSLQFQGECDNPRI